MNQADQNKPTYQDKDRPNGVPNADAPPPSWLEASLIRHTKTVMDGLVRNIHHDQHEYLEHRRLPHSIKPKDALTKPWLLETGEVIVMTVFPVAAETCLTVFFSPVFEKGHDPMSANPTPTEEDDAVIDFKVFAFREISHLATENLPQRLAPFVHQELVRQAKAIKLRQVQFLYATILQPHDTTGFDDPYGLLPKVIENKLAKMTAQGNGYVPPNTQKQSAKIGGPTPVDE